jgi:translation initiation factor 6
LDIIKYDVYRGPNIGLYAEVNDSYVFVPNGFAKTKAKNLADYLKVESVFTSIANTRLIGALMVVRLLIIKEYYSLAMPHRMNMSISKNQLV